MNVERNPSSLNYVEMLVEEIALEGLDGITLPTLWLRLEDRKDFPLALDDKSKAFLWQAVVSKEGFTFYKLKEPRPDLEKFDRFAYLCPSEGTYTEPKILQEDIYPVEIINKDGVVGSCSTYKTRTDITSLIRGKDGSASCSYTEAMERWGQTLVIVASQTQRSFALTGGVVKPKGSPLLYCFLERIGRARYNGVTSIGSPQLSFKAFSKAGGNKGVFSLVKTLMKENYVLKQTLVRRESYPVSSNLVHLKRFFRTISSQMVESGQKLCEYLQSKSQPYELTSVVKKHLGVTEKQLASVVRVNERLVIEKVPASLLFSDGEDGDSSSIIEGPEMVNVVKLVKGETHFGDDEDGDDRSDEEDYGGTENMQKKSDVYKWRNEESLIRQVYEVVARHEVDGITQHDLQVCLGLSRYNTRSILRYMNEAGLFHSFVRDVGKHRTTFFVTKPMMELSNKDQKEALEKFKELTTDTTEEDGNVSEEVSLMDVDKERDSFESKSDDEDSETSAILSQIQVSFLDGFPVKIVEGPIKTGEASGRMLRRAITLLNLVQKHKVIDNMMHLAQIIRHESPEEEGIEMCRKTLLRMIDWCCREGKLQKYCVKLEKDKKIVHVPLVCANGIDNEHKRVKMAIQQAKLCHFHGGIHKRSQLGGQMLPKSFCDSMLEWNKLFKNLSSGSPCQRIKTNRYGSMPKMQRASILHKYLWYLVYGFEGYQHSGHKGNTDGQAPLVSVSTSSHGTDGADEIFQHLTDKVNMNGSSASILSQLKTPRVYLDVWDWRRYLPPLRKHTDVQSMVGRTEGVCMVADIIMHMPVCIFCQLISLNFQVDGLSDILEDKDLRLYPLSHLPTAMAHQMMDRRRSLFNFMYNSDVLCQMGLLSYGPFVFQDTTKLFMYLHKSGTIYDTRESQPGYRYIRLPEGADSFPRLTFSFKIMDDVSKYWTMLQTVTLGTTLYARQMAKHDHPPDKKPAVSLEDCTKGHVLDGVLEDGTLPGDHGGAGGMDSSLFLNLKRNWYSQKNQLDQPSSEFPTPLQKPGVKRRRLHLSELSDTEYKPPKGSEAKKKKALAKKAHGESSRTHATEEIEESSTTVSGTSVVKTSQVKGNKGGKGIRRVAGTRHKIKKTRLNPQRRKVFAKKKRSKEDFLMDKEDEEALRNMDGERVRWTPKEMTVLLMSRVAGQILLPGRDALSCPLSKYTRDILHQRLPNLAKDKTQFAITRKLNVFLRKDVKAQTSVANYIMRAQMDKKLMAKYAHNICPKGIKPKGNFFVHYKALINDLLDKFLTEQEDNLGHLPPTVGVLKRDYQVVVNRKPPRWQDVRTKADVCKVAVRDMQMTHILSMGDKQGRMFEMYSTMRQYPDSLLSDVFDKLMRDKLIIRPKFLSKGRKLTSGAIRNSNHFSTTNMYFHKTRSPAAVISLFTQSFQLFDELLQVHSRGVQNHSHQIPTEDTANREDDGYLCLTGAIEAGAVSSMITLTALRQVSLKLELPTEIFRLSDAFHNPRLRRGVLAKQLLSSRFDFGDDNDDDDDFGENIRKKGCKKTLAGDASSRLPGLMSKASSARSAERGSTSGRVERKRKREIVEEGSQDEATSDSPQFKLMKLSDAEEGSFAMPECTAQQYRQQAVLDEGNRCRNMLLDNVAVQFEKTSAFSQDSKSLDSRGRSCGASFTLISLLRMSKESEKDPRMPSKVDRFVVNSLEMRMRLRDPPAAVASGTAVQLPVAEVPATLSQSVVQIARADGTPLSTSEASKTSLSLQTAATPDREAGRAQGSQLLVDSSVMEKIVRRQQKLLPFSVDMETLWKDLEQTIPADDLAICQTLYADIDDGGMLGRTWGEMQRRVNNVEALRRCLEVLIEADAVVRVGVTSWRYVSLPQARPWLICTLKNTRGRGHLPAADDQVCVSLEPAGEAEKSKADNASQGTLNASNNESGTPLPQHPKGQNPAQSMEAEDSSGRPCTSAEQDTVGSASVEDGLTTAPPDPAASDSTPGGDSSPRKRTRAVREKQQTTGGCYGGQRCRGGHSKQHLREGAAGGAILA
ncbi:general transcription factor 3C polypeptide 1-like [Pomacea canaliculata]|uniref:general transcription factor 3C polypeptide 1-like n=1 Tax=Pomacea canaliculata TaxID=400727 RepID=UPI000D7378B4|nr:general transcription factor 3C polypeptide 1-like [Pomacea canaliculata]XP_025106936.1 general transcription factor 3C polypeptide 1-like [Pomacea canaliculata]